VQQGRWGGCARAGDVLDVESGCGGGRCVHRACTQQGDRTERSRAGTCRRRGVLAGGGVASTERGRVWPEGGVANRGGRGGVLRRPGEAAGEAAAVAGQRAARRTGRKGAVAPWQRAARRLPGAVAAVTGSGGVLRAEVGGEGGRGDAGGWEVGPTVGGRPAAGGAGGGCRGKKPLAAVAVERT
jgi:hypothetical protein